jgi:hypothetical protein
MRFIKYMWTYEECFGRAEFCFIKYGLSDDKPWNTLQTEQN